MKTGQELLLLSALAIYLGTVMSDFFTAVIRDLLIPLLSPFDTAREAHNFKFTLTNGVTIKLGDVLVRTLSLGLALLMVFVTAHVLERYASKYLRKIYQ
jgi:large-conductance mechanosensitive channel